MLKTFGDSLTAGMYVEPKTGNWRKTHPYSIRLQNLFNVTYAQLGVRIVESGVSGERTLSMKTRLKELMIRHDTHRITKLVIILGGTNDLNSLPSKSIIDNIIHLHSLVLKQSKKHNLPLFTFLLTIPFCPWGGEPTNIKRLEINKGLRDFAIRCQERIGLFDMEDLFDQKNRDNEVYWSPDNVHFSPTGT